MEHNGVSRKLKTAGRYRTDDANYVFKNERSLFPPQQRAALDVGLTFHQITQ